MRIQSVRNVLLGGCSNNVAIISVDVVLETIGSEGFRDGEIRTEKDNLLRRFR